MKRPVLQPLAVLALSLFALPGALPAAVQEIKLAATAADETLAEHRQAVALLPGGGYAMVWQRFNPDDGIWMQWVRPDGSPVFPAGGERVTYPAIFGSSAVLAANPAGGVFVAFVRDLGTEWKAEVQFFDATGSPRWGAGVFAVTTEAIDLQSEPQLIADGDGGAFVCLQAYTPRIVCQHLDVNGARAWTDAGVQAGDRPGQQTKPRMVSDGQGGLLVFWVDSEFSDGAPIRARIEGQHLAADGTRTWGGLGRILRNLRELSFSGSLIFESLLAVPDGQGGAVISFHDQSGDPAKPSLGVYAQRVAGDSRRLWGTGTAVATGVRTNDALIAGPDGGAFVTELDGKKHQLWLHRLGPDGRELWKSLLSVADGPQPDDWGACGSFDDGRLRLAWNHRRQAGLLGTEIRLAVFDANGKRLNGPAGKPLTNAREQRYLRGLVFDPARRQGLAVWDDNPGRRSSSWDVAGALYTEAP